MGTKFFAFLPLFACVMLLFVSAAFAANDGGNSLNAKSCQKGGWQALITSTGSTFSNAGDCTSYGARGQTLYPIDAQICFDPSWTLIEDQFNGADGSTTSGIPCADFVAGGGSLAGVRLTQSGTSVVSYTVDAFAVSSTLITSAWRLCYTAGFCIMGYVSPPPMPIDSPYTYTDSGSLDCTLTDHLVSIRRSVLYAFETLGGHGFNASTSCSNHV